MNNSEKKFFWLKIKKTVKGSGYIKVVKFGTQNLFFLPFW